MTGAATGKTTAQSARLAPDQPRANAITTSSKSASTRSAQTGWHATLIERVHQ
jgi:hypothetical protein